MAHYYGGIREARGTGEIAPRTGSTSSVAAKFDSGAQGLFTGAASELNIAVPESETIRRELASRRGSEIEHREKVRQLQVRIESLGQEMAGKSERLALELGRRDGRITELQTAYAHLDQLLLREQAHRDQLLLREQTAREKLAAELPNAR